MQNITKKQLKAFLKEFFTVGLITGLGCLVFMGFVVYFDLKTYHLVLLIVITPIALNLSGAVLKLWEKYRTGAFNLTKGEKWGFILNFLIFFGALYVYLLIYT